MFGVVQRRAVFGTLRALGATPGQILALVLAEAGAASALGALLGLGLGVLLGQGAVRLVTQTINDLYFVLSVREAPLTALAVARGLALGIGAGLLAALAPAIEAARVEPVTALRASTFEARTRGLVPWVAAAGLLLCAAGGLVLASAGRALLPSFAGLFGIVLGLALMTPLATAGLMRVLTPVAGLALGTLGRLAARTVTRAAARTGVAIAALMVAVATTIGVTLMIQSFREAVDEWLELALRADVYVSAAGARSTDLRLPPELRSRVRAVPGVGEVESIRLVEVQSPLGALQVAVTDARHERNAKLYRLAPGAVPEAWARVQQGAVLMSEPFASRYGVPTSGGHVRLSTDRGEQDFPVAGVYYDYASERGTLLMHRAAYERFFDDRALTSLAVYLAPGAQLEDVLAALRRELGGTALQVTPNASLKRTALKIFDRTFAVTEALRVLAVVVAFIGVWSALLALMAERTRELHTLQALGLTPRQLWALAGLETGLMGLAAGLFALPTGTLLASILVSVINVRSFGWTMALRLEPGVYVQALAISVSAALLAGVYPLLRLQRQSVAAGLRQE
jgi:putative ABC transport system permease protein